MRTVGDIAGPPLVLASASRTRREMLERAGVPCRAVAPGVDEAEVKRAFRAEAAGAADLATALAELKARTVSAGCAGALVVGADQVLECEGRLYDKPADADAARAQIAALSGRVHHLVTAAAVVRDGARLWHHVDRARLTMRPLSPRFIDAYLDAVGGEACESVGGYRLEGLGAQLFSRVEGDFFTVLGLPLLPLLGFLRAQGVVPE